MGYLFLANLGPIQSFIESGRRTRDLWFGSTLLSELSKTAAWAIVEREGIGSLIFPAPEKSESLNRENELAVTNKIIAYIEGDPTALGTFVRESVKNRLIDLKQSVYEELEKAAVENELDKTKIEDLIDKDTADKQIEALVEFVWVAIEYEKEEDDYAEKRKELERWLAARTSTRNFSSVTYGSEQRKSSISGQLESVMQESIYPSRKAKYSSSKAEIEDQEAAAMKEKRQRALRRYAIFGAGPSEYLSGVDLLKRKGRFEYANKAQDRFLSTSHIATIPYLERLERFDEDKRKKIEDAWKNYTTTIQKTILAANPEIYPHEELVSVLERIPEGYYTSSLLGTSDGALLFEERLREDFPDASQFRTISEALTRFFKVVEEPIVRPHPYYAILRADGDGMGELIGRQAERGPNFTGHQEVSRKLSAFAGMVKNIVEKQYEGTLLYSGGDDVLAFLPLHTVLLCARELSQAFKDTLAFEGEEKRPTLSVGIAIVHHLSLLNEARKQARDVEEVQAKGVKGKAGLAITLYRRGGEEYGVKDKLEGLDDYLAWLTPYFMGIPEKPIPAWQRISLPKGTAYELRDTRVRLKPFADANSASSVDVKEGSESPREALQQALKVDMLRILRRKLKASAKGNDDNVKMMIGFLLCIFKRRLGIALDEDDTKLLNSKKLAELIKDRDKAFSDAITEVDVDEFINEFIIAHELADAYELTKQTRLKLQEEFAPPTFRSVEGVRQ